MKKKTSLEFAKRSIRLYVCSENNLYYSVGPSSSSELVWGRQATNGVQVHSAKVKIVNIRKMKRKRKDGGHGNYYLEIEGIIQKGI